MSIGSSFSRRYAVDADDRVVARVDTGLLAGGRFLDAHLRNAGLDRFGHAAELFDLLDHVPMPCARSRWSATPRSRSRPTGRRSRRDVGLLLNVDLGVAGDARPRSRSAGRSPRRARSCAGVCVWPSAAPIASMAVRATLLNGSCSVSDQPDVCECVRRASDLGFFGSNCFTILAHSRRAARILAISMKWFMPIAQKNDSRGANVSTLHAGVHYPHADTPVRRPACTPARCRPSRPPPACGNPKSRSS